MSKKEKFALSDAGIDFNSSIDEQTGFLTADVILSRTGIQDYAYYELPFNDLEKRVYNVLRVEDEVTSEKSLKSFVNLTITDGHPKEFLNIDNCKELAKGSISEVKVIDLENGEKGLQTKLKITDKNLIDKIKNGKKEVSVGYDAQIIKETGDYKGVKYDFVQKSIIANHLAVVGEGRCGKDCKILIDSKNLNDKDKKMAKKVRIGDTEFEANDCLVNEINKLRSEIALNVQKDESLKDESLKDELTKLKATIDTLQADKDNLISSIDDKVSEKIELLKIAGKNVDSKMSNLDIKKAIVKNYGIDITDKTEVYLDAVIEVKKAEKVKNDLAKASDGYSSDFQGLDYKNLEDKEI